MAPSTGTPIDSTSTRGRIAAYLRRGAFSVEEIAKHVGTTRNAVRAHLSALERDGLVRTSGVRRGTGAGKPATLYTLTTDAELMFSRAYPEVLTAVMDVLADRLDEEQAESVLQAVGARLAQLFGGEARGTLDERVEAAVAALVSLGGDVGVSHEETALLIQGYGCPLAKAVREHPETCHAMRAMVEELTGRHTEERCEHGANPQCRFAVGAAPSSRDVLRHPARPRLV